MNGPLRQRIGSALTVGNDGGPHGNVPGPYAVTVRITPQCGRPEVTKPFNDHAGWIALVDAIADRWGSYGCSESEQTLWAEVDWHGCNVKEGS